MKKIFVLLLAIVFPLTIFAVITGSGTTSTDPYTGSMTTGTFNIPTGTSYFHQITVSGGTLNIAQGAILKATQTTSYITISGTGVLNANGDSGANMITFTSNVASWARMTFSSSGASILNYCIIEKGKMTSGSDYGGGLLINSSNITVSNCIFQSNRSDYGGGIFVNSNANPTIKNCHLYSNNATQAGGGLYIYTYSGPLVENCLIEENTCTNTSNRGGGGVSTYVLSGKARIINCTIVNNTHFTPNTNYGNNVEINGSNSGLQYINCAIWGNGDPCILYSANGAVYANHFVNCALQSVFTSGGEVNIAATYTNSFKLNSSNTGSAPDGPYFNAYDGTDWSLQFRSPCRDKGISTGTPAPPSADILGKPRVGPYDIGAYEVQYSRWTGTSGSSWSNSGNWQQSITPSTGTGDVIIPTGLSTYPDESSVTIGAGKFLILDPKSQATFGTLDNSSTGTLWLKSDSHGINDSIASLKVGTYNKNSGAEKIELYVQGNGTTMWHYISPPVASIATSVFYYSGSGAAVTEYRENLINNDMNNGWVTSTGYHLNPSTLAWESGSLAWSNLLVGHGYNYFGNSSKTFTLQGAINTGDVTVGLTYNSGGFSPVNTVDRGYNLIGNPYTCGLDWDAVVSLAFNTGQPGWSDVEQAIYFRKNGTTYYYIGGSTVPSGGLGNPIAPMQGFFIHSKTNFTLKIPAATAKVHTVNPRFKGSSIIPGVRLQLENSGTTDETLIKFDTKATLDFDNSFDARKLSSGSGVVSISSSLGGTEYAINAIPFPESTVIVPIIVSANTTGSYTIKAIELLGLENYNVYLNDKLQNTTVNLSQINSYSFSAITGVSTDRFTITISNVLTALPETSVSNKPFNIYSSGEQINIQTLSDDWSGKQGSIKVLDLTGRVISLNSNIEFSRDEIKQVPVSGVSGIYLVEIRSGIKRYVWKVVVR